jgi:hypothetical protein
MLRKIVNISWIITLGLNLIILIANIFNGVFDIDNIIFIFLILNIIVQNRIINQLGGR